MKKIYLLITLFLNIIAGTSYAKSDNALDFASVNDYGNVPDSIAFSNSNSYNIYVNQNATGNGDGSSWANAFVSLRDALSQATAGAIVWVARGVYKPTNDNNRDVPFRIKSNVLVYGGFVGNETSLEQRNWQLNETILSGNIGDLNSDADNSYHVVEFNGAAIGTTISGFTIRDGNDNETDGYTGGGGIRIWLAYQNFRSSPTIEYCKIIHNKSNRDGGAIYIESTNDDGFNLTINQCLIANNSGKSGGAIYMLQKSNKTSFENVLNITNCTIASNISTHSANPNSAVYFTFYSNTPMPLSANITNCILWGNNKQALYSWGSKEVLSISYSNIQGKGPTGTNIDTDPYFTNPNNDDFSISNGCSPVVNTGTNNVSSTYDLYHNPRIRTGSQQIDMGAYEYYGPTSSGKFYLKPVSSGKGFDWENARSTFPAHTQECAVSEVWVASGTYKPTTDNDRNKNFTPLSGVKYYGGFAGTETTLEQRNWGINKTILSGNIGNLNDSLDNSFTVIRLSNVNGTLLDGFTIQDSQGGSGIRVDNTFSGQANSVLMANCIITKNNAAGNGGGIYNLTLYFPSEITLVNTAIYGNSARVGGGIANFALAGTASFKLINCTITQNTATNNAGATYNYSASNSISGQASLYSSIIWDNIAPTSPGIENFGIGAKFDAFYSNIQDITPDASRKLISSNPWFMNPAKKDYSPSTCGQSLDTGNNAYLVNDYPAYTAKDILGNNRLRNNIDMGAYEHTGGVKYSKEYSQLYVNKNATGNNDGTSWVDAYTNLSTLQEISCVRSNTIWIAGGTHYPTAGTDRNISFEIRDNIKWYGGFVGNESTLESRNWAANPTILSGNIGDANTDADNSYHVLKLGGSKVLLDGFIIEKGNAQGGDLDITYQRQSGGGILLVATQDTTELTIRNCIICNNEALYGGGGIAHFGSMNFVPSSLKIYGSLFTDNKSAQGASIYHYAVSDNTQPRSLSTQLINCTISKNSSDIYGTGGIHYTALGNTLQSVLTINNSIVWDNPSLYNTPIDVLGSESNIALSNTAIANNRFAGSNLLNTDPQFDTGTFTLKNTSPCRNVGDNAATTLAGLTKDLGFNDRLLSLKVDLGAYEGLCLINQTVSQTFNNGTLTVQDGGILTSTSKAVPTSNTTFDAKNAVVLQPGFTAGGNGVVFTAQIGGCN